MASPVEESSVPAVVENPVPPTTSEESAAVVQPLVESPVESSAQETETTALVAAPAESSTEGGENQPPTDQAQAESSSGVSLLDQISQSISTLTSAHQQEKSETTAHHFNTPASKVLYSNIIQGVTDVHRRLDRCLVAVYKQTSQSVLASVIDAIGIHVHHAFVAAFYLETAQDADNPPNTVMRSFTFELLTSAQDESKSTFVKVAGPAANFNRGGRYLIEDVRALQDVSIYDIQRAALNMRRLGGYTNIGIMPTEVHAFAERLLFSLSVCFGQYNSGGDPDYRHELTDWITQFGDTDVTALLVPARTLSQTPPPLSE